MLAKFESRHIISYVPQEEPQNYLYCNKQDGMNHQYNLLHSFIPNDFPLQNWPFSVSHFNKFRLTTNFYRFRCLLAIFHTKIMLVLYDMGLFFNSTICGVTFDSRD